MKRIGIFCGSSDGTNAAYITAARVMGQALAARGFELVYGGGHVGLMGVIADAALEAGGRVIGVMPQSLIDKEIAHRGLTELLVVQSMHERKAKMAELSDAFIAMPGGFGTYDEFCEILTWAQLGYHRKPVAMLNVAGFYDGLLAFFDYAMHEGFIRSQHRAMLLVHSDPLALLDDIINHEPAFTPKWVNADEL